MDMLGGARYRRRERRGSAVQANAGAAAQDSKLEDTFYAPTQKERNRNLVRPPPPAALAHTAQCALGRTPSTVVVHALTTAASVLA